MNTFEINIQRKSGNHWPIVIEHSRPGELLSSRSEGILSLTPEDFQQLTSLLGQPKEYGIFLGKALFKEEIRDAFVSALRDCDTTVRMLLFIEAEDKQIRTLRWERLCGNIDDGWHLLSLEQRTPYSLYIPAITDRRFPPIGRRDLRALILVASPSEIEKYKLDSFDVEAAVSGVRQALGEIPCDVLATVEGAIGEPTLDELCKHLTDRNKQYTMLHFVSHSRVIDGGETVLYWAKAENQVDPVTGTRLIERLRSLKGAKGLPHFTFLSTCESASPEAEAGLGGFGQRLVRDLGMPAVIAMTEKVTVKTALALGAKFYEQLGKTGEVDIALQEAAASLAERQDITVPALFSRLGGRPLFSDQLDRDLTNAEIKYGLVRLEGLLKERSPILQSKLEAPAEKLVSLLNTDSTALSKEFRREREQALEDVNNLCLEVLDLSFNAVALDREPPIYDASCPFLGLYPFRVENQKFFFGREGLIIQLQQKLEKDNFLAVFGASGSGKSSVVLAGLIPALTKKQPDLVMAYMTPSSNPIEQLHASLLEVQNQSSVIVIDQFEELFTLCTDDKHRILFIEELLVIVQQQKVVITMRADFWGECASYPQLKELIQSRQELIGPMDTAELRKSMEMQAAQVGLRFEAGLSNQILDDVQGEPGAMPLLQHALLELWKRRHGRWLRAQEYEAIGGVNMAIAQTADAFYDSCTPQEQEQVKNIFIRLTRLDDSTQEGQKRRDTRRRVWLEELIPTVNNQDLIERLLKRLSGEGARLVVTSLDSATQREEVEVAHEALIRYWPRLLKWLDENRSLLLLRENIRQVALDWDDNKKDESYLVHRGGRLEEAQELLAQSNFLNLLETDYIQSCQKLRDRQQQEQKARRRREIRTNRTIFGGTVIVFITTSLGLIAFRKGYEAQLSKADSLNQSSFLFSKSHKYLQSLTAGIKSAKILKKTQFWTKISGGIINDKDQIDYQSRVIAALQQGIYGVKARNYLTGLKSSVRSLVFSPDGTIIATLSLDKTVQLRNLQGKELELKTPGLTNYNAGITGLVFSPDSKTIITTSVDNSIITWDLEGNELSSTLLKPDRAVTSVVFSPDSKTMATISNYKTVKLWDLQGNQLKKSDKQPKRPFQHQEEITTLAFSPDGETIATGSQDNTVILWDLDGNQLQTFEVHEGDITSLAFSPDGSILASGAKDNSVILWNLGGKLLQTFTGHQAGVTSVAFSLDGKNIASASLDNTVKIWDLAGKTLQTLNEHKYAVTSVVFISNTNTIAAASQDNTVQLWNFQSNFLPMFSGYQPRVPINDLLGGFISVVFAPKLPTNAQRCNILAAASKNNTVLLWDLNSNRRQTLTGHKYAVTSVAFSPNCDMIASGSVDNTIILWDLTGKKLQTFTGHQATVTSVAFSPDSKNLVSGSDDKTVILWDLTGKKLQTFTGHKAGITSVAFHLDGYRLASASLDRTVIIWDLTGKKLQTLIGHQAAVTSIAFSNDGKTLASASDDKTIKLWDLNVEHKLKGHQDTINAVVFSHDGKSLASGSDDNTIKLWDLKGNLPKTLTSHRSAVKNIVFSADDQTLASASENKNIKLWDLNGKLRKTLTSHQDSVTNIVFSADGTTLGYVSKDHRVKLWDFLNENLLRNLEDDQDQVTNIAFSPDGTTVAVVSKDQTVELRNLQGNLLTTFKGHKAAVKNIVFSYDGKIVASASEDNTVILWDLKGNQLHIFKIDQKEITSIALSPDSKTIASASVDNTIKLWDLQGNLKRTLIGHEAGVKSIAFSPDGYTLASGSADNNVILWDINDLDMDALLDNLMVTACSSVRDYLDYSSQVEESDRKICNDIGNRE
ncbi:MAG: CHAT domain-containing protein [Gloeotrichia echinulata HAB0833]